MTPAAAIAGIRPALALASRAPAMARALPPQPSLPPTAHAPSPRGELVAGALESPRAQAARPIAAPAARPAAVTPGHPPGTPGPGGATPPPNRPATLARRPAGEPAVAPPVAPRPAVRLSPSALAPRTLARATGDASDGGGGGAGGGGGDGDQVFAEVLRRVREEQEQLGQLISHPF